MMNTAEIAYRASLTRSPRTVVATKPLSLNTSRESRLLVAQALHRLRSENLSHVLKAKKPFHFRPGQPPNEEELSIARGMSARNAWDSL